MAGLDRRSGSLSETTIASGADRVNKNSHECFLKMREARWSTDTPREERRMIRGFHHVAVTTPDLERFIDHYERWFGFERVAEGGWEPVNERVGRMVQLPGSSARYAMIRLGSFYMEVRSEEHTSELQSLMRNSYAVFCLTTTNNI